MTKKENFMLPVPQILERQAPALLPNGAEPLQALVQSFYMQPSNTPSLPPSLPSSQLKCLCSTRGWRSNHNHKELGETTPAYAHQLPDMFLSIHSGIRRKLISTSKREITVRRLSNCYFLKPAPSKLLTSTNFHDLWIKSTVAPENFPAIWNRWKHDLRHQTSYREYSGLVCVAVVHASFTQLEEVAAWSHKWS